MIRRSPSLALARDQRGAMMLIGLFMAVFLVGLLYYVVGIGEAIAQREGMQDAADAAAFSAATLLARGMNTLALCNMVMAALLAILVALKLVETLAAIAIVLIAALAFLSPGLATFIPGLQQLRADVRAAHDELAPPIHDALATLHSIEHGIRVLVPAAAQLRALELVREHHRPPAEFGFVLPLPATTLPTEDGAFAEVCDRAAGYTGDLVKLSLSTFTPDAVSGLVGDATDALAAGGGTWFCGDGKSKPPEATVKLQRDLPILPARTACADYDIADPGYDARHHAQLCSRAEADEQASAPNDETGACEHACQADGPYAQRAALAREQCRPDGERKLRAFESVQRQVERRYVFHQGAWRLERSEVVAYSTRRVVHDYPPCGAGEHAIAPDWELALRAPHGEHRPLCSNERAPQADGIEGAEYGPVHFAEVVDLLGCVEHTKLRRSVERDAAGTDRSTADAQAETPQRIAADAQLGEDAFQVRAIALGPPPPRAAEDLIRLASWGRAAPAPEVAFAQRARVAARTAFAQAEYFYAVRDPDGDERGGYLWNMRWQARFRRFRLPEHTAVDARGACTGAGADGEACAELAQTLDDAERLLVH